MQMPGGFDGVEDVDCRAGDEVYVEGSEDLSDCTPNNLHTLLKCTDFKSTIHVPTLYCTILPPCTLHTHRKTGAI